MSRFAVLEALAEEERRRILAAATRRKFGRNEVVFHQGELGGTFHLIDRGHVKISVVSPTGDRATLAILGPGDAFGEQALLVIGAERTATVTALEPTHTLMLRGDDFHDLRSRHPSVNSLLVEVLAAQVRRLTDEVAATRFVAADARIARHLVRLAEIYGDGGNGSVEIPLSQDEVAQLAGTTRPTVNRFLKSMGEAVALSRGRIAIGDLEAIAARA